ncbi:TetR/AcrR family transcriptional regulator [Deinococcus oregonensis]|uniref:TetR/AcrR family transcriptional regulator n=1 Tax=Deinococcus oregonensis TaxID=1805970 RepID=A0ABV6ASF4_9DEIO
MTSPPPLTTKTKLKSARKPGRQSAEVADQTKLQIIRAALAVFARSGFEAASLRDIAADAASTHSLIRHHFGSKEGVWQAVVNHAVSQYTQSLRIHLEPPSDTQSSDPVETLRSVIRSMVMVSATHSEVAKLLMREGSEDGPRLNYLLERLLQSQGRLIPLLLEVQKLGYLKQFDPPMFLMSLLVMGDGPLALPALVKAMTGHDVQSPTFLERHIATVIETLLPRR